MSFKKLASRMLTRSFRGHVGTVTNVRKGKLQFVQLEDRAVPATFNVSAGELIQDAIDAAAAAPGADTIEIAAGTYTENLIIDDSDSVELIAVGSVTVTSASASKDVIKVLTDGVSISGLTISGGRYGVTNVIGTYPDSRTAINGLYVNNNTFVGQSGSSIVLDFDSVEGSDNTISENTFSGYGTSSNPTDSTWAAIDLSFKASATINGNTITVPEERSGIRIEGMTTEIVISDNTISVGKFGTGVSANNVISGLILAENELVATSTGAIGVTVNSVDPTDGSFTAADNEFTGTFDIGYQLWNVVNTTIEEGSISGAVVGVQIDLDAAVTSFPTQIADSTVEVSGLTTSVKVTGTSAQDVVNCETGIVYFGGTKLTFDTAASVILDGKNGGDKFTFTDGTFSISDSGTTGTDTATINGTSEDDEFIVGESGGAATVGRTDAGTVTFTAGVETVSVLGLDGKDKFGVTLPSTGAPSITLDGGAGTTRADGDTLTPTITPGVNYTYTAASKGSFGSAGKTTVNWTSIETYPAFATGAKYDFNSLSNATETGFVGVANTVAFAPTTSTYGWVSSPQAFDRLTAPVLSSLYRDGAWNTNGKTGNVFRVLGVPGTTYGVRAYIGDPLAVASAYPAITVSSGANSAVADLAANKFAFVEINATANESGYVDVKVFSDSSSNKNWFVNGIEFATGGKTFLTTAPSIGLTVSSTLITTSGEANGGSYSKVTVTGAPAGASVTLTTTAGTLTTAAPTRATTPITTTVTLVANGSGTATAYLTAPVSFATNVNATLTASELIAGFKGTATQTFTAATALRFDFATAASPIASGFVGVTGTFTNNATTNFGWTSITSTADRGTSNALARDIAWGNSGAGNARTFAVKVGAANQPYVARIYLGDTASSKGYNNMSIGYSTGGTTTTKAVGALAAGSFKGYTFSGTADASGNANITISASSGSWVSNGLDIALTAGNLPAVFTGFTTQAL